MKIARQFMRQPMGMIGVLMLLAAIIPALFAPQVAPYDPYERVRVQPEDILAPPDAEYFFGRDDAGKDVLSQLIYGAQVSLFVGFVASIMSMLIGTAVGLVAGFFGGKIDSLLMRFVDFLLVIPDLPLALVIIAVWGRGIWKIILVITLLSWLFTARLVRAQTLSIKQRQFVLRAKALGASSWRMIFYHILPQVVPLIIAQSVLTISNAILTESALSFLGLGDPNLVSWGNMLNYAFERGAISRQAWWVLLPPGLAIIWVSVSLILIGTAVEEVVNPRLKSHHLFNPLRMVSLVLPLPPPPVPVLTPDAAPIGKDVP